MKRKENVRVTPEDEKFFEEEMYTAYLRFKNAIDKCKSHSDVRDAINRYERNMEELKEIREFMDDAIDKSALLQDLH